MKTILSTLVLATALTALAGQENVGVGAAQYNPEAIYNALKVKAVALNPGIVGASRFQKSVGGLACTRSMIVVPNATPTFECQINQSKVNFAAIYKAMNVEAVAVNAGIVGSSRFEKSVGGLTCTRSMIVVPNAKPTFECEIAE